MPKYTADIRITVDAENRKQARELLKEKFGTCEIVIKNKTRSSLQNRALHLWFTQLGDLLNERGLDMRLFIKEGIDIPWDGSRIKEAIWRPTMKTMFGNKSTKDMTTGDVDKIFDVINKAVGERLGEHLEFPSIKTLMNSK